MGNNNLSTGPLSGIKILNIGTSIVAPWASSLLAHLGAEVIKVEKVGGEFIRTLPPTQNGVSSCYSASNIDQKSTEFNLKNPDDLAVVIELAKQADILVENYRPGVADRIGLGFQALSEINSKLIYASSSSWGDSGPMKYQAALDSHVQAFTGFGGLNGTTEGPPEMLRFVHMDPAGATFFAGLILLGLIERQRFGTACNVKTSHFAMGIAMQMNRAAESLLAGNPIERLGSASSVTAPNACFKAFDGKYIAVACDTQKQWKGFCRAIEREDLITDARFASNLQRVEQKEMLMEIVEKIIKQKPSRWWVVKFENESVPYGFSLDFETIRYHQQIVENNFLVQVAGPHIGEMTVGGLPWRFSDTPAYINPNISTPGEHTEVVLEKGFSSHVSDQEQNSKKSTIKKPLVDMLIIDATEGYAGPFLGLLLAEAGARVIKVEPSEGDWTRQLSPQTNSGNSALFDAFNHNKKSLTLDLDTPNGQSDMRKLLADAVVLLEDWGPNVAENRNLGYEQLSMENPGLINLSLSPFGEKGPLRHQPASELTIQAMTGYLRVLGKLGDPPIRVGADIVGTCTGAMAFVGVLAAVYHRERTGKGQRLSCSLLGSMMSIRSHQWAALSKPDEWKGDSYCTNETNAPHYGYKTKDGAIFMTPSPNLSRKDFVALLKELKMELNFFSDPDFKENWWHTFGFGYLAKDAKNLWEKYTCQLATKELLGIFENYPDIWITEFSDLGALMDHPQVEAIGIVNEIDEKKYIRAPWSVPWDLPPLTSAPELNKK